MARGTGNEEGEARPGQLGDKLDWRTKPFEMWRRVWRTGMLTKPAGASDDVYTVNSKVYSRVFLSRVFFQRAWAQTKGVEQDLQRHEVA